MKRSKFTEEQIVRILGEVAVGRKPHVEIARQHGVSLGTLYVWKRKHSGVETDDLRKLRELEQENSQLKRLLAERDLEIDSVSVLL